jgi:mediator of RNA polymerase II transcription subunit 17
MASTVQVQDQPWRNLKISLERPYKDSQGKAIPVLSDITPEGEHVYEPYVKSHSKIAWKYLPIYPCRKEDPSKRLGERIRRVFAERGVDLFDGQAIQRLKDGVTSQSQDDQSGHEPETPAETHKASPSHTMTSEELLKMRMEIMPHLQ